MLLGVFLPAIARGVVEGRRRCATAERPVVADIGPDAARDRLDLGQDRHGRVVPEQALAARTWPRSTHEAAAGPGAGADLVGERRHAQIDAFAPVAFALAVEGLMLAELLNRIMASRFGPAKPRGVTWKGAGGCVIFSQSRHENFFPHRLDDLPLAWQWRAQTAVGAPPKHRAARSSARALGFASLRQRPWCSRLGSLSHSQAATAGPQHGDPVSSAHPQSDRYRQLHRNSAPFGRAIYTARWLKILPIRLANQRLAVGVITVKYRSLSPLASLFLERARQVVGELQRA